MVAFYYVRDEDECGWAWSAFGTVYAGYSSRQAAIDGYLMHRRWHRTQE